MSGLFNKQRKTQNDEITKKHFLEDKPLEKLKDDKFQYNQVAEILYDLLNQNNFPTHIGLFAPWGSGKTSVIKLLEDITTALNPNGNKYIIKTISVWKFADDAPSLHRKIVREVQAELDVLDEEGISNESTQTESAIASGVFSALLTRKPFKLITITYIILILSTIIASIFIKSSLFTSLTSSFLSLSTIALVIAGLKLFIGSFQRTSLQSVKTIPLAHGDQYEAKFKASVSKFLERNHGKNLVLVFDDLDRLPPKQLLAALNTIKTFLHSKNCAFILPCDETVLRNGIKTAFEKKDIVEETVANDNYVTEFINKTFDYQIHLPILEQKNMKRYAKQLLLDQQVTWVEKNEVNLDKILGVLIHSSIKTPRQVKTLLNSFSLNWELAKKRDNESGKKILSADPLAIAVFTVIKTDFPEYFLKLITNPFLVNKIEEASSDVAAYLSRVAKCIPKDDPRPFIYFSNEKLNPATGRPDVLEAKNCLLNAQLDQFKSSFMALDKSGQEILLSSVISDFDDNPGIEVDNCIKTLIDAELDLSVISEMDLQSWDLLIRDNLEILTEFPPSKVCGVLKYLTYDNRTWSDYGEKINVSSNYNDLFELWIENSEFIQRLNISNLALYLENNYIENGEGYLLTTAIYQVPIEHEILNSIDWIRVIKESFDTNSQPEYSMADWLQEWSLKTKKMINTSLITELLNKYDFITDNFLQGIGQLWCDNFSKSDSDLNDLLQLMDHESFCGFNDIDYARINDFLGDADYSTIRGVIRPLLDQWWSDDEKYKKVIDYLNTFTKSPGIPGFCEAHFSFDLDEEVLELFLKVIIDRGKNIRNGISNVLETIITELNSAVTQQKKSLSVKVIKTLLQSHILRTHVIAKRELIVPLTDKSIWLNWPEVVVLDRLEMFLDLWDEEKAAVEWIFDCIDYFANITLNYISSGRVYNSNASRYVAIFTEKLCSYYINLNWNDITEKWTKIKAENGSNNTIDLFSSLLDSSSRSNLIGQLSRRCSMGLDVFNQLLVKYYDASVNSNREALYSRWEVIGVSSRKAILEGVSAELHKEESKDSINLLELHFTNNPLLIYLNEIVEWNLEENIREKLISILIQKLTYEIVADWVNSTMENMNKEGFHKWKGYSIEKALKVNKISVRNAENTFDIALGLGNDRARLALQLILASNFNKNEIKKFRDRIISLHHEFPEYVERFGFRFKLNRIS